MPLCRREWAWALKRDFPDLDISLNGEIEDCHQAAAALQHRAADGHIYGVMVGRSAYNRPWDCLSNADVCLFGATSNPALSRRQVSSGRRDRLLPSTASVIATPGHVFKERPS